MFKIQKVSVLLAIFAWLMQLSVFIAPVLVKHTEWGVEVCAELEDVAQFAQHPVKDDMASMMVDHTHHEPMLMQSTISVDHSNMSHAHSMSDCEFCTLFAHQFNPILLGIILILLAIFACIHRQPMISVYAFGRYQKLYFYLFQNRAPPLCHP